MVLSWDLRILGQFSNFYKQDCISGRREMTNCEMCRVFDDQLLGFSG